MRLGDFIGPFQLQAQAPVEYVRGSRTREINGRLVKGSWSDPWWAYAPEYGFALIKRWKNREVPAFRDEPEIPATDEYIAERFEAK